MQWLTTEQAASRLNLSASTIRWHIFKNHLKAVKIGGRWQIDPGELEAFSLTNQPQSQTPIVSSKVEYWKTAYKELKARYANLAGLMAEKKLEDKQAEAETETRQALRLLLAHIDYINGNCYMNQAIGLVLPEDVLRQAREAIDRGDNNDNS